MNSDNKLVLSEAEGLIPQYRFPEFKNDGNWEISSLSDKIDYERPDKYIVKNTNYLSKGTPVLTANKSFILGYTDENNGIYEDNLPVIIFDDFTVDNKYVDFPFKVKSSAIKILKNKNEDDSLKFFYELMSQIKFEAKEHKRYYISAYQKIEVPVPTNPAEQQKVAACLSSLDDVIAGHEEKLTLLEEHKKGLMQNLFPQKGETQPKYRFPEFENDGDWLEKKLGNVIELRGRIGYRGYTVEDIVNLGEGAITLSPSNIENNGSLNFDKLTYISWFKYEESPEIMLSEGFTVLVKTGSTYGKAAYIKNLPEKATVNPQIVVLKPLKINSYFLYLIVSNVEIQKQINETVVGGAIPTLSQDSILKFQFHLPVNNSEQQKIASVLSSVEELIVAQREKIAALKEHKKGLMQGLFPKIES